MPLIVDSHEDLAWNILSFGRDYLRSVYETRPGEKGSKVVEHNGDTLLGWPEYQRAGVAVVFATLFSPPTRWAYEWETLYYKDSKEAHSQYLHQLEVYYRLVSEHQEKFSSITSVTGLDKVLAGKKRVEVMGGEYPVGLVILMEGADGIVELDELEEWWESGLRIIGPAWAGTRFCGGTKEPGPLTPDGRNLLTAMADIGFILDLSHMDEIAVLESLDFYQGPIVATHANCLALLPGYEGNRHMSDRVLQSLLKRNGMIGIVPYNPFLKGCWQLGLNGREEVSLEKMVDHIDYVCQLAGDASHVGIGTDFDGGFGLQSTPFEIDTIADLHKLAPLLSARGYSQDDIAGVLGGNWVDKLRKSLPQ